MGCQQDVPLKTNLQVHIDTVRDSGVLDAIRLLKLWMDETSAFAQAPADNLRMACQP